MVGGRISIQQDKQNSSYNAQKKQNPLLQNKSHNINQLLFQISNFCKTQIEILVTGRRRALAFTLAEVLITIAIIGIVVALTIPSIIHKCADKITVIRLNKAYSTIYNAYKLAQNEYGDDFAKDIYYAQSDSRVRSDEFLERLMPFFPGSTDCRKAPKVCFPGVKSRRYYYNFLEKKGNDFWPNGHASILLKDGTLIIFYTSEVWYLFSFIVDINGPQAPNHYGHDTFFFDLNWSTNINKISPRKNVNACRLNSSSQARGCAWWVLTNKNRDYLRCDLDWNMQTKCK